MPPMSPLGLAHTTSVSPHTELGEIGITSRISIGRGSILPWYGVYLDIRAAIMVSPLVLSVLRKLAISLQISPALPFINAFPSPQKVGREP